MLSLVFCRPGQLNTMLPSTSPFLHSVTECCSISPRRKGDEGRSISCCTDNIFQQFEFKKMTDRFLDMFSTRLYTPSPSELWDFHQPLQKIHVISCFLQQQIGCAHWRNWFPMSSCTNGVADIVVVSPWLHLLYWSDLRNLKWVGPISHHVVLITFVPTKASSVGRLWGNWCHCVRPPFPATSRIDHIYPRKDINLSEVLSLIINQILYLPTQSIWRGNLKEAAEGL